MAEEVLLPPNATSWERSVAGALEFALDAEIVLRIKNPDTCPVQLLPYLAAEESLDDWHASWPEAIKRAAIKGSWAYHRRKGTPAAMDALVAGLGPGWSWAEWFQYGGRPYRFRLTCSIGPAGFTFDTLLAVRDRVNRTKNVRSIMEFVGETAAETTVVAAAFAIVNAWIGNLPEVIPTADVGVGVFAIVEADIESSVGEEE